MTTQEAASDFSKLTYLLQLVTTINSEDNLESSHIIRERYLLYTLEFLLAILENCAIILFSF
jgi:hypothetical protein